MNEATPPRLEDSLCEEKSVSLSPREMVKTRFFTEVKTYHPIPCLKMEGKHGPLALVDVQGGERVGNGVLQQDYQSVSKESY